MRRGTTLIEILVSLGLASIVFLIVSSLMVTFYTSDTRSKQLEMFERTKNDTILLLSNAVRWATSVERDGGNLIIDESVYSLRADGRLYKNEDPFTSEGVKVTKFEIQDFSANVDYPSLQIDVSLEDANNALRTDTIKIVTSVRKTTSLIAP